MPNSDKSFVNPFSLVGRFFSWFFGQFPDTVLIAMSVLGAGLLVIGSLYFIGHMSPKEPVVNMDHVYHDAYRIDPVPVHVPVHHQVPVQLSTGLLGKRRSDGAADTGGDVWGVGRAGRVGLGGVGDARRGEKDYFCRPTWSRCSLCVGVKKSTP